MVENITIPAGRSLMFMNVGETAKAWVKKDRNRTFVDRRWENCIKFGFMSAGYGKKYSGQLNRFKNGDVFAAFITKQGYFRPDGSYADKHGYCGIGKVVSNPCPIKEFRFHHVQSPYRGQLLTDFEEELQQFPTNVFKWKNDRDLCEHFIEVQWEKTDINGFWETKLPKLFSTQLIVCSLEDQSSTIEFIEEKFGVNFV